MIEIFNEEYLNQELYKNCKSGNLEMVKHLMNSPSLDMHAKIVFESKTYDMNALSVACKYNHFEIVEYICLLNHHK